MQGSNKRVASFPVLRDYIFYFTKFVNYICTCVVCFDRLRPKNRRSVLSQGDERWKDIVQELEIRQSGYYNINS